MNIFIMIYILLAVTKLYNFYETHSHTGTNNHILWIMSCIFFYSLVGPVIYTHVQPLGIKIYNFTYSLLLFHTDRYDQGVNITYSCERALWAGDNYRYVPLQHY